MRIGVLADVHAGFHRYHKTDATGVNIRESDFYQAATAAVANLLAAGVDAILDLGDLADSPHPRKRAIRFLIELINSTGLPWHSVDGNHTKIRYGTDIHLYRMLETYCPQFRGYTEPAYVEELGALLVPYGSSEEIKEGLALAEKYSPAYIAGHFATDDVLPDGHDIPRSDLPNCPAYLGHYHARRLDLGQLVYIGATERKAWGEANNPTGAAVLEDGNLTFVEHVARPWVDLTADADSYLDVLDTDTEGAVVRLTLEATIEQYRNLNLVEARRRAKDALDFSVRRRKVGAGEAAEEGIATFSLADDWREHAKAAKLPRGVKRAEVTSIGTEALRLAGVAA